MEPRDRAAPASCRAICFGGWSSRVSGFWFESKLAAGSVLVGTDEVSFFLPLHCDIIHDIVTGAVNDPSHSNNVVLCLRLCHSRRNAGCRQVIGTPSDQCRQTNAV